MLGTGKSSGCVNEASNLKANENLTATIEQMNTAAYMKNRDLDDVIPTHKRHVEKNPVVDNAAVFNPEAERKVEKALRGAAADESDDEDDEFLELRRMRLQNLKSNQEKEAEWRSKQHGEFREIGQDDFFNIVVREKGGSELCCVHFYHKDFETCKVMDRRLSEIARTMLAVKFVKIDAERSPFLVERLRVTTLPCLLLFKKDVCVDRVLGFEGCVSAEGSLDGEVLRSRIARTLLVEGEE